MYVGSHYNSYHNSVFGNSATSVYGMSASQKIKPGYVSPLSDENGFYNQSGLSSSSVAYVQNLKNGASAISSVLNNLHSEAFGKNLLVSSNPEAMSLTATGKSYNSVLSPNSVSINQLATGQQNSGEDLKSGANVEQAGIKRFAIETDGKSYQFSISLNETDTNKDMQQKMADAINKANIGIEAQVEADKDSGTSALNIQAEGTGDSEKNRFTIRDVEGDAVAKTGADRVKQEAQDALYSVNGGAERSSKTNTVDLGNGVTATLKQASGDAITISRSVDKDAAISKVKELANAYNQLYGAALNNESDGKANNLLNRLVSNSHTYSKSLVDLGIGFDANGYMTVDSDKAGAAVDNGKLENFFRQDSNYGFTSQLSRIADDVSRNTQRYVSQSSFNADTGIGQSSIGTAQDNFLTSYQYLMQQNNMNNISMLFNFTI